jgi:hypothetical protein
MHCVVVVVMLICFLFLGSSMTIVVIGFNWPVEHDHAVGVIVDGELVFASEEERWTEYKHLIARIGVGLWVCSCCFVSCSSFLSSSSISFSIFSIGGLVFGVVCLIFKFVLFLVVL